MADGELHITPSERKHWSWLNPHKELCLVLQHSNPHESADKDREGKKEHGFVIETNLDMDTEDEFYVTMLKRWIRYHEGMLMSHTPTIS